MKNAIAQFTTKIKEHEDVIKKSPSYNIRRASRIAISKYEKKIADIDTGM